MTGEELSVVCELSVGQVCGSGEYQVRFTWIRFDHTSARPEVFFEKM